MRQHHHHPETMASLIGDIVHQHAGFVAYLALVAIVLVMGMIYVARH